MKIRWCLLLVLSFLQPVLADEACDPDSVEATLEKVDDVPHDVVYLRKHSADWSAFAAGDGEVRESIVRKHARVFIDMAHQFDVVKGTKDAEEFFPEDLEEKLAQKLKSPGTGSEILFRLSAQSFLIAASVNPHSFHESYLAYQSLILHYLVYQDDIPEKIAQWASVISAWDLERLGKILELCEDAFLRLREGEEIDQSLEAIEAVLLEQIALLESVASAKKEKKTVTTQGQQDPDVWKDYQQRIQGIPGVSSNVPVSVVGVPLSVPQVKTRFQDGWEYVDHLLQTKYAEKVELPEIEVLPQLPSNLGPPPLMREAIERIFDQNSSEQKGGYHVEGGRGEWKTEGLSGWEIRVHGVRMKRVFVEFKRDGDSTYVSIPYWYFHFLVLSRLFLPPEDDNLIFYPWNFSRGKGRHSQKTGKYSIKFLHALLHAQRFFAVHSIEGSQEERGPWQVALAQHLQVLARVWKESEYQSFGTLEFYQSPEKTEEPHFLSVEQKLGGSGDLQRLGEVYFEDLDGAFEEDEPTPLGRWEFLGLPGGWELVGGSSVDRESQFPVKFAYKEYEFNVLVLRHSSGMEALCPVFLLEVDEKEKTFHFSQEVFEIGVGNALALLANAPFSRDWAVRGERRPPGPKFKKVPGLSLSTPLLSDNEGISGQVKEIQKWINSFGLLSFAFVTNRSSLAGSPVQIGDEIFNLENVSPWIIDLLHFYFDRVGDRDEDGELIGAIIGEATDLKIALEDGWRIFEGYRDPNKVVALGEMVESVRSNLNELFDRYRKVASRPDSYHPITATEKPTSVTQEIWSFGEGWEVSLPSGVTLEAGFLSKGELSDLKLSVVDPREGSEDEEYERVFSVDHAHFLLKGEHLSLIQMAVLDPDRFKYSLGVDRLAVSLELFPSVKTLPGTWSLFGLVGCDRLSYLTSYGIEESGLDAGSGSYRLAVFKDGFGRKVALPISYLLEGKNDSATLFKILSVTSELNEQSFRAIGSLSAKKKPKPQEVVVPEDTLPPPDPVPMATGFMAPAGWNPYFLSVFDSSLRIENDIETLPLLRRDPFRARQAFYLRNQQRLADYIEGKEAENQAALDKEQARTKVTRHRIARAKVRQEQKSELLDLTTEIQNANNGRVQISHNEWADLLLDAEDQIDNVRAWIASLGQAYVGDGRDLQLMIETIVGKKVIYISGPTSAGKSYPAQLVASSLYFSGGGKQEVSQKLVFIDKPEGGKEYFYLSSHGAITPADVAGGPDLEKMKNAQGLQRVLKTGFVLKSGFVIDEADKLSPDIWSFLLPALENFQYSELGVNQKTENQYIIILGNRDVANFARGNPLFHAGALRSRMSTQFISMLPAETDAFVQMDRVRQVSRQEDGVKVLHINFEKSLLPFRRLAFQTQFETSAQEYATRLVEKFREKARAREKADKDKPEGPKYLVGNQFDARTYFNLFDYLRVHKVLSPVRDGKDFYDEDFTTSREITLGEVRDWSQIYLTRSGAALESGVLAKIGKFEERHGSDKEAAEFLYFLRTDVELYREAVSELDREAE